MIWHKLYLHEVHPADKDWTKDYAGIPIYLYAGMDWTNDNPAIDQNGSGTQNCISWSDMFVHTQDLKWVIAPRKHTHHEHCVINSKYASTMMNSNRGILLS